MFELLMRTGKYFVCWGEGKSTFEQLLYKELVSERSPGIQACGLYHWVQNCYEWQMRKGRPVRPGGYICLRGFHGGTTESVRVFKTPVKSQ